MPLKTTPPHNVTNLERMTLWEQNILKLKRHQIYPHGALEAKSPISDPRPGMITRATPIGTIGSCFASRLKQWLKDYGYNYVQTETGVGSEPGSARFGIVFNTGCLRQEFESALGRFKPAERFWSYDGEWYGGKLVDAYRQGIAWETEEEARADIEAHERAVREAVERAEVFIVTPGLSEVWKSRLDGTTFQGAPSKEVYNPERHAFALCGVEENLANLEGMYAAMREINPAIQLVVTLSPVPLHATFRDQSCVVSDSVSKAILRVAIDAFCRAHPEVVYFPSFEIVKSMSAAPYEEDNRHIRLEVVERIMTTFLKAYGDLPEEAGLPEQKPGATPAAPPARCDAA